jgi:hypothetical protein
MTTGTFQFINHQRIIREALRRGEYQLRECSASRDNEDLFNEKVQARILALLPPPVSFEESDEEYGSRRIKVRPFAFVKSKYSFNFNSPVTLTV